MSNNPATLFPAVPVFCDNAPGTERRERAIPLAFGIELPTLTADQIKAIPEGWVQIVSLDGRVIGACRDRVVYSGKKAEAIARETFAVKLTPEQELAAFEREAAELERKQAEAIAARRQAIMDQVVARQYAGMSGAEAAEFLKKHRAELSRAGTPETRAAIAAAIVAESASGK